MQNLNGYSNNLEKYGIIEPKKTKRLTKVGLKAVIEVNKFLRKNYFANKTKEILNNVK